MADRILLIEDDEKIRNIVKEYFTAKSNQQYEIIGVATGDEGMEWANRNDYDLVLLDINLGDGSGFDVCKKLREDMQLPILFISARQSDDDVLIALSIGGDE